MFTKPAITLITYFCFCSGGLAMDHAECVGLLAEAYEAKAQMWDTSQQIMNSQISSSEAQQVAKSTGEEAISARLSAQKYINQLADLCEHLR